jgi:hypothetical protein
MTWFRHQLPEGHRLGPIAAFEQFSERIIAEIYNFIRNSG